MRNLLDDVVLGIDVGGTKTLIGLVTRNGKILHTYKYPMCHTSKEAFFDKLTKGIDHLLADTGMKPMAIGVGLKGHVDADRNIILSSSLIETDSPYDLCAALSQRYGLPAAIDNDVNAATLAEATLGAGKTCEHFVYVNIGTGSAIGVYDKGQILRGRNNNYGEIGYMLLRHSNGELFCLEDVASGKGLDDEIRRLGSAYPQSVLQPTMTRQSTPVGAIEIFDACQKGDALAMLAVNNALEALALSIINFECLLDCGLYIFGGGIVKDPWFFNLLQDGVRRLCVEKNLRFNIDMRMSELGAANAGLLGAASVALAILK